ncbi:MAG TPA: hypothetical protein ENK73_06935 [Thiomicrospira sp.]|jgi:hypothetical protein|nr:hypothetical protein [Thiomicrospira sp.]
MPNYTLSSSVKQTEQTHGFWLLSFRLNEPLALPEALAKAFYFSEAPEVLLYLFQHADQNPKNEYQFLSNQKLDDALLSQLTKLQSDSNQTLQLANNTQPVLILANNLFMANAFAIAKQAGLLQNNYVHHVVLASDSQFPFVSKPARYLMPEMPPEAIGACTLLEDWNIQNRLVSKQGLPGCFEGDLVDFFDYWLHSMQEKMQTTESEENWQVVILADKSVQKKCIEVSQYYHWPHLTNIAENH